MIVGWRAGAAQLLVVVVARAAIAIVAWSSLTTLPTHGYCSVGQQVHWIRALSLSEER
jgi:hypothetical protein